MLLDFGPQRAQPPTNILDFCSFSERFPSFSFHHTGHLMGNSSNAAFFPGPHLQQCFSFRDMGCEQYPDLLARSASIDTRSQLRLRRTNSLFSDHVSAVEYFLQQKWSKRRSGNFNEEEFAASIKFMLSAFVLVSWQTMTAWHTYTKAHIPLEDLTAWRIKQTPEAYMKIIPSYRPTKLQVSTQHPAIIDWIPWPALRDKLIIYHSANPCLDDIICDIGNSYVVPCDLSTLVTNMPAMVGYVSVWDLVRAIAPDATSPDSGHSNHMHGDLPNDYFANSNGAYAYNADTIQSIIDGAEKDNQMYSSNMSLPAPDKATLFGSKALSIQAFKALGMDKGAATFCLDPEFFGRHPELYDPQCDMMARGVPLRPSSHMSIPIPRDLSSSVLGQYKELSRWAFGHGLDE